MSPNCFQISGNKVVDGIPTKSKVPGCYLPVEGAGHQERIMCAEPVYHLSPGEDNYLIVRKTELEIKRWYYIIYIEVPDLNFGEAPFFEGLNIWPGAEWHTERPLWRVATVDLEDRRRIRQHVKRAEIWVMKNNERLFLAGQNGSMMLLQTQYRRVLLSPVDVRDLVAYLRQRARYLDTHRGLLWAFENLKIIRDKFPGREVSNALDEVGALLRNLRA